MESIEDFYKKKLGCEWMPKDLQSGIGHFNVFEREATKHIPVTFNRRDFFKISLLKGKIDIHYADKTVRSDRYALMFSDPLVPYNWEYLDEEQSGYFCIFSEAFFHQYGSLKEYPLFQPDHDKVFLLDDTQAFEVEAVFVKMLDEIGSDYAYKYDVLRSLVLELVHYALKMQPTQNLHVKGTDKSTRIASLFTELLERQFPIESTVQRLEIKTPSEFAKCLNIHTNHLNRTLKKMTGKTTSEFIAQRIVQEAKILLKHTTWSIGDISFALGYEEAPHFINFFKKSCDLTPNEYRNSENV
jgi:AraC family transcriptional regulator, transcriptional activator of pobA